jgi:hypothetical protein
MRKSLFCTLVLILIIALSGLSTFAQQKVVKDSTGNYTLVSNSTVKKVDENTGKFFVDKNGNKYPILKSVNGKYYYWKKAKSGNLYKVYIILP